jgi:outer membrane immunogenic protein
MKRTLLTCVGVLALASSALAADLPPPPVYKAAPPPAPSWTGCYVDAGGGAGLMTSNQNLTGALGSAVIDVGGYGWMGVAGGGCDYQFHVWNWDVVFGGFGDYDFLNFRGTASPGGNTGNMNEPSAWVGGARLGVAVAPGVLVYTDGGYTNARVNSINFVPAGITVPAQNYNGWFLGGGTETSLGFIMPGLFLRTEYRYSNFQSNNVGAFVTATGAASGSGLRSNLATQSVFTELVWRFNFSGMPW